MRPAIVVTLALVATGADCKDKKAGHRPPSDGGIADAGMAQDGRWAVLEPPPAAPEAQREAAGTPLVGWYQGCWHSRNAGAWDELRACYADIAGAAGRPPLRYGDAIVAAARALRAAFPDLRGEPQIVLVNGNQLVSIVLLRGTHDGPLKMPGATIQATHRPIGLLMGQSLVLGDAGKVLGERSFLDDKTLLGQLGRAPAGVTVRSAPTAGAPAPVVVVARGDDTEAKNVRSYNLALDALNWHDAARLGDAYADALVWSDFAAPADQDKAARLKALAAAWAKESGMTLSPSMMWGAGDYVVSWGVGPGDGSYLEVVHYDAGKIDRGWFLSVPY